MLALVSAPFSGSHFLTHLLEESEVSYNLALLTNPARAQLVLDNEVKPVYAVRNPWLCIHTAVNRHHNCQSAHPEDQGGHPTPLDEYLELQITRMELLRAIHRDRGGFAWYADRPNNYYHLMAYCRHPVTEKGKALAQTNPVVGNMEYKELQTPELGLPHKERVVSLCEYWMYDTSEPDYPGHVTRTGPSREELSEVRQARTLTEEVIQCLNPT